MKTTSHLAPSEFVAFASSLFRERQTAMEALAKGDTRAALISLEYMEVILSDSLAEMTVKSKEDWRTIDNCVAELLANDIPGEIQLSKGQADRFVSGAKKTLARFFRVGSKS